MVRENSLKNLKQPSKKKSEFAKMKTGMKYLTADVIKESLSKDNNLSEAIEKATAKLNRLLTLNELTSKQIAELNALSSFIGRFLDKAISSKTELTPVEHNINIRNEIEKIKSKAEELKLIRCEQSN